MSRSNQDKRIAEHFTYFLASEGYLKDGYSINKREMNDIFMYQYLVKHPVRMKPFLILQFLLRTKCVKRQRKKNAKTETFSGQTVVFNAEKVQAVLLNYGNNPEGTVLDKSSEKPVVKVYVTQQHAFDMKYKRSPDYTEKECKLCKLNFSSKTEFEDHINKESHKIREKYRNDRKLLQTNRNVIIYIQSKTFVGYEEVIARPNVGGSFSLNVYNGGKVPYQIMEIYVLYEVEEIVETFPTLPLLLNPGKIISLPLEFEFCSRKAQLYPVVLKLSSDSDGFSYVLKEVVFRVQLEFFDDLKPTSPYVKPLKPVQKVEETPIIYGEPPPPVKSGLVIEQKLSQYELPASLRRIINHGLKKFLNMTPQDTEKLNEVSSLLKLCRDAEVSQLLREDKYSELLSLLLYIEEHQMEIDIRMYDRDNVTMNEVKQNKKLLSLDVPGLSENRPSVLRGDRVYVRIQGNDSIRYEGVVHAVRESQVWLGFNKKLLDKSINGMKFHVEYSITRLPMRVQHRGLQMIKDRQVSYILFPKQHSKKEIFGLSWYNKKVSENPQQQQAVMNIVAGTAYPSPYLVFGPPGTGKTVTVVEAITQLYHLKKPKGHLLVCAPSNSAADEIARRLIINDKCPNGYVPESSVLRLYAASRNPSAIPEELKGCSNYSNGEFYYPSKADIMKYNIVIVTLTTSGRLVSGGIPAGHFSHLFIDECGQAVEPETLIPLAGLFASQEQKGKLFGNWVLVGDPKQLGPVLRSPVAKRLGLGMSLLERLMVNCDLYQKSEVTHQYNPNVLTKLVQNFRSHKHILALPNKLFYDNELQEYGNPLLTTLACNWEYLPKRGFPLIFHGVNGKDVREANSPSYFNVQEIDVVVTYVERILEDRFSGRKLEQKDIGIITPYRKQVEKIRNAFKKKRWDKISVGSVEEFQGQERSVIIISTVRSTRELVNEDYKFHLGFLRNPKRFNVALTRSKALLIIVGDPNVLQYDIYWRELITFCKQNGSCIGCKFKLMDMPPQEQESLVLNLAALQINPTGNKLEDGPQWRGDI